jgi:hypothetical protein
LEQRARDDTILEERLKRKEKRNSRGKKSEEERN